MSYQQTILSNGPILYYRLQDAAHSSTVVDASGNANAGNVNGTITFAQSGPWNGDNSALFDGSSGYITTGSALSAYANNGISLEAWIYASAYAGTEVLIDNIGHTLSLVSSGELRISVNSGGQILTYNTPLSTGVWHMVVGTWDGSTINLYVDGSAVATGSYSATPSIVGNTCYIGASATPNHYFSGNMAEVAIFNSALTANQVWTQYTSYTPASNLSPGSQRNYTLQDLFASVNQDAETAGNNLLNIDNTSTQIVAVQESPIIYDGSNGANGSITLTHPTTASQTWDNSKWGEAFWTS